MIHIHQKRSKEPKRRYTNQPPPRPYRQYQAISFPAEQTNTSCFISFRNPPVRKRRVCCDVSDHKFSKRIFSVFRSGGLLVLVVSDALAGYIVLPGSSVCVKKLLDDTWNKEKGNGCRSETYIHSCYCGQEISRSVKQCSFLGNHFSYVRYQGTHSFYLYKCICVRKSGKKKILWH